MLKVCLRTAVAIATAAALSSIAAGNIVISDNFETDTSANYTVVNDGTPNGTSLFNFDYIAAGIPLAPRSTAGDIGGLRFTANDSAVAVDALTAFHNTGVAAPHYKLTVDVYWKFTGTTATTEHAHVGVGGNGTTFNQVFTPISGSGSFIAFTGDGGSGSDYRWYLDSANGGPTTVPNSDPSYLGHGSNNTGAFYQALFPSPPATVAGSPGNIWTTLSIEVNSGTISYYFDNQLTFQGPYTGSLDGKVSLGIADTFTSVDPGTVFLYYDNLEVEVIPEPATLAGLALVGLVALRRR
jgi:hypothetical protein